MDAAHRPVAAVDLAAVADVCGVAGALPPIVRAPDAGRREGRRGRA